jgi:hypothetical protein
MSVEGLMNQAVTLRRRTGFTRENGEATPIWSTLTTTMYLEPKEGTEEGGAGSGLGLGSTVSGRHTPIGQWLGIGRSTVDFDSWQEVLYGDLTLEISSPVREMWNPRTQTISHKEMDLLEIDQQ